MDYRAHSFFVFLIDRRNSQLYVKNSTRHTGIKIVNNINAYTSIRVNCHHFSLIAGDLSASGPLRMTYSIQNTAVSIGLIGLSLNKFE